MQKWGASRWWWWWIVLVLVLALAMWQMGQHNKEGLLKTVSQDISKCLSVKDKNKT